MDVIIIESKAFQELLECFDLKIELAVKKAIGAVQSNKNEKCWLTLQEAQQLLPYNSKTKWQSLRDRNEVEFAIFGRKILYSKESIMKFITKNKFKL